MALNSNQIIDQNAALVTQNTLQYAAVTLYIVIFIFAFFIFPPAQVDCTMHTHSQKLIWSEELKSHNVAVTSVGEIIGVEEHIFITSRLCALKELLLSIIYVYKKSLYQTHRYIPI